MKHKAKKRITKWRFDKWAHRYDDSILQHFIFRTSHNMLYREIASNNHNGSKIKILDVGCGTGELAHNLARDFSKAEIYGVDISETMIKKAIAKKGKDNIKFEAGDVEDLPYKDSLFDIIACSHSFHHYLNKDKAMTEMYRVLKPDGRLMIIDGCRDVLFGRIVFDIVERIEKHVYHLLSREFRELFRKSGFNNLVQKRFNFVPLLLTIGTAIKSGR
ncbi:MAG: methyltransferase domain-containing protein [Candidatus Omnitrophica bacterium]|nr:methyltransferase domain-containing protein [Candidatus Omnitrophota bacterium]